MSDCSTLRSGKRAAISNLYLKSQFFELFHELEHYPLFHSSILWAVHVLSFVLRYVTIIYLKISNFDLFMLEIFIFCLDPTAASIAKTIVQRLLFMMFMES